MARHSERDAYADDGDDSDADFEGFIDDDQGPTSPCPYCHKPVFEDSPRCPHCKEYISEEDAGSTRKPWWIIVGAVLCLYVVYRWIMG
jgi:hypothetical protein